jgi:hypothetical protein
MSRPVLAGIEASRKMRELVKGHDVTCENRGHDRYGRMIGLCRVDGIDIQAAMVRAGLAWAFVRYSSDYVREEAQAKADRLGVFAHGCQPAWEWRAQRRWHCAPSASETRRVASPCCPQESALELELRVLFGRSALLRHARIQ